MSFIERVFLLCPLYGSPSTNGRTCVCREHPRETAARECSEETLKVLGDSASLFKLLGDYKTNNVFRVVNRDTAYVAHFIRVAFQDYPSIFKKATLDAEKKGVGLEVDEIKCVCGANIGLVMKSSFFFVFSVGGSAFPPCAVP